MRGKRDFRLLGLDFLLAQDFAEHLMVFGALVQSDFELYPFSCLVRSACHRPCFLGSRDFGPTFWTFSHLISSNQSRSSWFLMIMDK